MGSKNNNKHLHVHTTKTYKSPVSQGKGSSQPPGELPVLQPVGVPSCPSQTIREGLPLTERGIEGCLQMWVERTSLDACMEMVASIAL